MPEGKHTSLRKKKSFPKKKSFHLALKEIFQVKFLSLLMSAKGVTTE